MTTIINPNQTIICTSDLRDLEIIRPAMVDWLSECYEHESEDIRASSTAYLAKVINKRFDGGLRAFIEADPGFIAA